MKSHHFLKQVEHDRLQTAITQAEEGNLGDIVIYVAHHRVSDPFMEANKIFQKLGLKKSPDQVTMLFFIAPKSRTFAIIGSDALHQQVGDIYWKDQVSQLSSYFKHEQYTEGLVSVINSAGVRFKKFFPGHSTDLRCPDIIEE